MATESKDTQQPVEPRGFGEHTRGLAGEYAHEQGWGLDEQERTAQPRTPQDIDGGTDYDYSARDFGDEPVNTAIPKEERDPTQNTPSKAPNQKHGERA